MCWDSRPSNGCRLLPLLQQAFHVTWLLGQAKTFAAMQQACLIGKHHSEFDCVFAELEKC
jgi:hypothetical protein